MYVIIIFRLNWNGVKQNVMLSLFQWELAFSFVLLSVIINTLEACSFNKSLTSFDDWAYMVFYMYSIHGILYV